MAEDARDRVVRVAGETVKLERRTITLLVELATKLHEAGLGDWEAHLLLVVAQLDLNARQHEKTVVDANEPTPLPDDLRRFTRKMGAVP